MSLCVFARLRFLFSVLALVPMVLAGCIFDPKKKDPEPRVEIPLNDSPQNAVLRFELVYERQALPDYEKLFTSNFRFTFSNQSDPGLVSTYGNNWGKDDEVESTGHLFDGFTNDQGIVQGGASSIELSLDGASFIDDPSRPDSAAFYKYVIVPSVNLNIAIEGGEEFQISAPHDLYLVRGDVALLDAAQEARADRWYIYRWDDKSAPLAASAPRLASLDSGGGPVRTSWGSLRSAYAGVPRAGS